MSDHAQESIVPGEPEGLWSGGPPLYTNVLQVLIRCRFTGAQPVAPEGQTASTVCMARFSHFHADEDCLMLYFSSEIVERSLKDGVDLPAAMLAEVKQSGWNEPVYQEPLQ